jgi:hypothetical protein
MKKTVYAAEQNMQQKQKQKMKNTFLHWKAMPADLHQEDFHYR